MMWLVVAGLVLALVALLLAAMWAYQTAHRLDRLHVRYDLSWQALDGALARRAVVARAVAVDAYGAGPEGTRLSGARRHRRTGVEGGQGSRGERVVGGARPCRPCVVARRAGRRARRRRGARDTGPPVSQ